MSRLEQYLEMAVKKPVKKPIKKVSKIDYSEVVWKMDKWMPDDADIQDEYYDILDDTKVPFAKKVSELYDFISQVADEEAMHHYMPKGGTLKGLAEYLAKENS